MDQWRIESESWYQKILGWARAPITTVLCWVPASTWSSLSYFGLPGRKLHRTSSAEKHGIQEDLAGFVRTYYSETFQSPLMARSYSPSLETCDSCSLASSPIPKLRPVHPPSGSDTELATILKDIHSKSTYPHSLKDQVGMTLCKENPTETQKKVSELYIPELD